MSSTDRNDWTSGGDPASGDWPPPGGPRYIRTADTRLPDGTYQQNADGTWSPAVPYEPPARLRLRDRVATALVNLTSRRRSR